ncbi:MAG: DMT family transporter [Bacillota bacterium]|nr:DMT family transporter [Bacillota bacterium]
MGKFLKGVLLIVMSAAGYGAMPIFAKSAYSAGASVQTLLFIRFLLASLCLFIYIFIKKEKIKLTLHTFILLLALGLVCYTAQSTFYFFAMKYISASLAVLLLYTYPILVYLFTHFVEKQKLNKRIITSIIITFTGIVLVMDASIGKLDLMGVLFGFGAGIVYSAYVLIGNKTANKVSPIVTSGFVTLFASIGILILGISTKTLSFHFGYTVWFSIAGLTAFSTILAIITFFKGLEILGSIKTSILSMLEPFFVIAFSCIFLGDSLSWLQAAGSVMVLTGAALIVIFKEKDKIS